MDVLLRQIEAALPPDLPNHIGVAVSGGSDSTALLQLLHSLSQRRGFSISAVTVNHGLRPEAAGEAAAVAQAAAGLNVHHDTLVWSDWDGAGNTQNEARKARYGLMTDWAQSREIPAIALGHTLDDQAETVVMRLARGAGVDGLSAMRGEVARNGVRWLRPLLGIRREMLRNFLRGKAVPWHDDPTNVDTRYDRIKVREALAVLEPLGVSTEALGQVAENMQSARAALDAHVLSVARRIVTIKAGAVKLEWQEFCSLPTEIARRLTVAVLKWMTGAEYAPRGRSIAAVLEGAATKGSATLEGCRLLREDDCLWIFREYNAVKDMSCAPGELWDGRWSLSGPETPSHLTIAALGPDGLSACSAWRETGLPRDLLLSCPAVWSGGALHAAPLAGKEAGWRATLEKADALFF